MIKRLKEMGEIDERQSLELRPDIIKNARKLGYSTKLYEKSILDSPVIISEYAELANNLLEKGKITNGKYEELLIEGRYFDLVAKGYEEEFEYENEDTFDF